MKIPGKATISNRTSTMASQFARARAPYFPPTREAMAARYALFQIDPDRPTCAYCGADSTEWDHLFPMVEQSLWTGFFTEIDNLIPACGKCNQSRGRKPVGEWMRGPALLSPRTRFRRRDGMAPEEADAEIERRIAIIERAVEAAPPRRMPIADDPLELELERCRIELNELLHRAERIAAELRRRYQAAAEDLIG